MVNLSTILYLNDYKHYVITHAIFQQTWEKYSFTVWFLLLDKNLFVESIKNSKD